MKKPALSVLSLTLASTTAAQDGLVVGYALGDNQPVQIYRDGGWQPLFQPTLGQVWALAADATSETIFYLSSDQLYAWTEADGERLVGTIFDPNTGTDLVMVGMGVDPDGTLYVTRDIGGVFPQGFYEVDKTNGVATLADAWPQFEISIAGFDFDPVDGTLFAAQGDASPNGRSWMIVTRDDIGPWTYTPIAPFPAGLFDVDGAAISDGIAYLVTDDTGPFYSLDLNDPLATPQPFASPWTGSGLFAGAAFAPWLLDEPCTADTNGDGDLTPADFNTWVQAFNKQSPACDQNGDGLCNPQDFNAWIVNFNAGC
ncbi:MAG: GC-type dockerin domain-anchored protein [Planctomycetota bacterium]